MIYKRSGSGFHTFSSQGFKETIFFPKITDEYIKATYNGNKFYFNFQVFFNIQEQVTTSTISNARPFNTEHERLPLQIEGLPVQL